MKRISSPLVLLVICLLFSGCGESLSPVTGTVTSGGKPLEGVWVNFNPTEGRGAGGVTDSAGKYELSYKPGSPGAMPGKYEVLFGYEPDAAHGSGGKPVAFTFKQTVEVTSGANTHDFEVPPKDVPKRPATKTKK